jgi:uncharacterized protein YcaQ
MPVPTAPHQLSRRDARRIAGDRLVGKLDATADPKAGVLRVNAIHEDVAFSTAMRTALDREIRGLADLVDLEVETAVV